MKIDILTLFPKIFTPLNESIIKRAQEKNLAEIKIHDLRDWTTDKHKSVDAPQYGGGAGMVLRVDVVDRALRNLSSGHPGAKQSEAIGSGKKISKDSHVANAPQNDNPLVILLSPQGKKFDQQIANEYSKLDHLILIAGHYEGFDQRIRDHLVDEEISIGDYVLTGGELPAMVITDSIMRLIPGVLGDDESLVGETHSAPGKKKHPVYTRPENYNGWKVPDVLLSGNHAEIEKWRKKN